MDDLHGLIRSLDATERRFFTLFAQRHSAGGGNHYLLLFQWMVAMEDYDPHELSRRMKDHGFASPLPAAKNHLKSMVMRALRAYRNDRDAHTRLLEGLANLDILHEKKQFSLLAREIRRLKKLALQHGHHHVLFRISDHERRLHKETARKDITAGMEAILQEANAHATAFLNQLEMTHLLDRVFLVAKMAGPDRWDALQTLLSHPLLADATQAQTAFSRMYFHQTHAIAAQLLGDHAKARANYESVLSCWEEAPHLVLDQPGTYRRILSNYLGICHVLDHYEPFPGLLAQIRSSPSHGPADNAEIFSIGHYYELLWRMGTLDWRAVHKLLPEVRAGLDRHAAMLDTGRILAFCYNCAIYLFLAEDYRGCRRWLRDIIDRPRGEQRMDIQQLALVLQMLCSWALDDPDLMAYQLKSLDRAWEGTATGGVEQAALGLGHALLHAHGRKAIEEAYGAFARELGGQPSPQGLGSMELQAWARARINYSRPLDVIVEMR